MSFLEKSIFDQNLSFFDFQKILHFWPELGQKIIFLKFEKIYWLRDIPSGGVVFSVLQNLIFARSSGPIKFGIFSKFGHFLVKNR